MHKLLFVVGMVAVLCGCASSAANLQQATARTLGYGTPSDMIIAEVHRSMTTVEWEARTPQGRAKCWSDDMLRQPMCRLQKGM